MGVSKIEDLLTESERKWAQRINKENRAKTEFKSKWDWMLKYYEEQETAMKKLKQLVEAPENRCRCSRNISLKTPPTVREGPKLVLPKYPETTSQEIGWLSSNPAFALETVGPYPNTRPSRIPVHPPGLLPVRDIDFYVNDY
ncbi:hypothetical protein M8J77_010536 [Diaphorina citri]|nr:hypothetical protein M8J77_010536 [Diaphorina citri]